MPGSSSESLRFLSRRPREVWQGGLFRLPMWITPPGEAPYRPWCGLWVKLGIRRAHAGMPIHPSRRSAGQALETFIEMARDPDKGDGLPERVEVTGAGVAEAMGAALSPLGVGVVCRDRLTAVERLLEEMAAELSGGTVHRGALEPAGMTLERFASFAEAARLFYEAALWRQLTDEDLIRVERPRVAADLSHVVVLGAGGNAFGLMFFESQTLHERLMHEQEEDGAGLELASHCSVFFGPITELPLEDSALFEDHGLPVAGPEAYPCPVRFAPPRRVRRLGTRDLAHVEAILRALAATTEAELDTGRWSRVVPSADGTVEVALALPEIADAEKIANAQEGHTARPRALHDRRAMERGLVAMSRYFEQNPPRSLEEANREIAGKFSGRKLDDIPTGASTPLERAQDLCYEAFDARGRRRVILARRALEICPDCADAYVIQAERAGDPQEAARLYREGVRAGERALGPKRFKRKEPPFWSDVSTRPYMRALEGLAETCAAHGQEEEAIAHYQRLLELNPGDNQGVRFMLAGILLEKGDDAAAGILLRQFKDDPTASFVYAHALWRFRTEGDSATSRRALRRALKLNPFVPKLLLDRKRPDEPLPSSYSFGSRDEAAIACHELRGSWKAAPGALEWLKRIAAPERASRRKAGSASARKAGRASSLSRGRSRPSGGAKRPHPDV